MAMPPGARSPLVGALGAAALLVGALRAVERDERAPRAAVRSPAAAPEALGATLPSPLAPVALRCAWPATGRVRVDAVHRLDGCESSESFLLEWRTLEGGERLVEAFPLPGAPFDATPPGARRTAGTPVLPVQAVVSAEGRFLHTPFLDELRATWCGVAPPPGPPRQPLAERWDDWVGRWTGIELGAGEESVSTLPNGGGRARLRCAGRDAGRVRFEWRLEDDAQGAQDEARALAMAHDVVRARERSVEAELVAADARPLAVRVAERWTWTRGGAPLRALERESRYAFDWSPRASYAPPAARSDELPALLWSWAGRRWPGLEADARRRDGEWWRAEWSTLSPARRALLISAAGAPGADLGLGRPGRLDWMELRTGVARAWAGADALRPPRFPALTWLESGPPECTVDVLILGDGYTAADLVAGGAYWADVSRAAEDLLAERPFSWYRDAFNVRALAVESEERGCDLSWRDDVSTALGVSLLDGAFHLDDPRALRDALLLDGRADVVLVLVNTDEDAGTAQPLHASSLAGAPRWAAIVSAASLSDGTAAHEVGHAFAELADEYEAEGGARARVPRAPNVTDRHRSEPWAHFRALPGALAHAWSHEGACRRSSGAFRPWPRCRMRDAADPFCPVCCEELARAIQETCGIEWDDGAYHRARPLALWSERGAPPSALR